MVIKKLRKLTYEGQVTILIYMLISLIAILVMLTGVFLILEEVADIAMGTRAFTLPSWLTMLEFGWPILMGFGIWVAGAAIRLIMTGVRAFPLRLGSAPEDMDFYD